MTQNNPFTTQPLSSHKTVGERLRDAREGARMSIADAAKQTKILAAYLEALEKGRYSDLPSQVYVRNYLQVYTRLLGLSWSSIEPLYKQEVGMLRTEAVASHEEKKPLIPRIRQRSTAQKIQAAQSHDHKAAIIIPRVIRLGVIVVAIMVVALYVTFQIVRIYYPPKLEITEPGADIRVTEDNIRIFGSTTPESIVEMNGQQVNVLIDGSFSVDFFLQPGLNTVTVSARSERSSKREVVRYILYTPPGTEEPAQ